MSNTKFLTDETGMQIPISRVTKSEKMREKASARLLALAKKQNAALAALKQDFYETCQEVYDAVLEENKILKEDRKGNFTWYNFDRSIKVETSVNSMIQFDEMLISLCKDKLMEFIDSNVQGVETFVKDLIMDAFSTSAGKLDTRKVMSLLKHRSKIKDARYHEAMELLEKSIRRPDSRMYFRIFVKDEVGQYQGVDLNFSSVEFLKQKEAAK